MVRGATGIINSDAFGEFTHVALETYEIAVTYWKDATRQVEVWSYKNLSPALAVLVRDLFFYLPVIVPRFALPGVLTPIAFISYWALDTFAHDLLSPAQHHYIKSGIAASFYLETAYNFTELAGTFVTDWKNGRKLQNCIIATIVTVVFAKWYEWSANASPGSEVNR